MRKIIVALIAITLVLGLASINQAGPPSSYNYCTENVDRLQLHRCYASNHWRLRPSAGPVTHFKKEHTKEYQRPVSYSWERCSERVDRTVLYTCY